MSANPDELKVICTESKNISKALGNFKRTVSEAEENKKLKFRRSLVVNKNLKKGHVLTKNDLSAKRPGTFIPPNEIEFVVGRTLNRDLGDDDLLKWNDLL